MVEFTEAQLVEIVLTAAKRGYNQALEDAEKKGAAKRGEYAQQGIEAFRERALELLRHRLAELKDLKANEVMISGFNEAIEHLEYGVETDWEKLKNAGAEEDNPENR